MYFKAASIILLFTTAVADSNCPCGWIDDASGLVYTHRIKHDFSTWPDVVDLKKDVRAKALMDDFMIYDFAKASDNHDVRLDVEYEASNIQVKNGAMIMKQKGYTVEDHKKWNPVSISGLQTRNIDILHGSFRVEMKLSGFEGSTCASFFWYHNDAEELDIKIVTPGTSIVNDTINYTTQPSANPDWSRIPGATKSYPLKDIMNNYKTHRFDCNAGKKLVEYYLDNQMVHSDTHNFPTHGGSIQLKLWSDGNFWWSGMPSSTDVFMDVRKIVAYFNTTTSQGQQCQRGRRGLCKAEY